MDNGYVEKYSDFATLDYFMESVQQLNSRYGWKENLEFSGSGRWRGWIVRRSEVLSILWDSENSP